jgi:hypothetical protein
VLGCAPAASRWPGAVANGCVCSCVFFTAAAVSIRPHASHAFGAWYVARSAYALVLVTILLGHSSWHSSANDAHRWACTSHRSWWTAAVCAGHTSYKAHVCCGICSVRLTLCPLHPSAAFDVQVPFTLSCGTPGRLRWVTTNIARFDPSIDWPTDLDCQFEWNKALKTYDGKQPRAAHSTYHTAHITHHTAHITQHTSHITQHTSHSTQHSGCISGRLSLQGCRSGVGQGSSVQQCASARTTGSQPLRSLWNVSLAHSHISAAAGLGTNSPEICVVAHLSHPCGGRTCYAQQQVLNVFSPHPLLQFVLACAGAPLQLEGLQPSVQLQTQPLTMSIQQVQSEAAIAATGGQWSASLGAPDDRLPEVPPDGEWCSWCWWLVECGTGLVCQRW